MESNRSVRIKDTKEQRSRKTETVRSELNLEQNPVFTVSNYPKKSREAIYRKYLPTGEINESKVIIGKTADGVNGDNNLENIRHPDETWKFRLIEEDFKRLMFEVEDI